MKLPEDIQHALVTGQITSGHARALLMVKNDADMRVMFGKILGSGLSVREAEALADYSGSQWVISTRFPTLSMKQRSI